MGGDLHLELASALDLESPPRSLCMGLDREAGISRITQQSNSSNRQETTNR